MTVTAYSKKASGRLGAYTQLDYYNSSVSSPRDSKGDMVLKPNPHTLKRATSISGTFSPSKNGILYGEYENASVNDNGFPSGSDLINWAAIDTVARAKFDGKIRKGRASLGVQVVKYAQTRDMILGKYQQLKTVIAGAHKAISRDRKLRDHLINLDRLQRLTANEVLQFQFGWKNLFKNLNDGLNKVIQDAEISDQWFTAAHKSLVERTQVIPGNYTRSTTHQVGRARTSVSGQFVIDNPNHYLLDRSGILSVPAIAWDLVPWSWVVNMFFNTNQLVNQLTDEVGIRWVDVSHTRSARLYRNRELLYIPSSLGPNYVGAKTLTKVKFDYRMRTVGQRPPVSLMFRLPELDYKNATIFGAVILQRMKLISWAAKPPKMPRPSNWREVFPPGYIHL